MVGVMQPLHNACGEAHSLGVPAYACAASPCRSSVPRLSPTDGLLVVVRQRSNAQDSEWAGRDVSGNVPADLPCSPCPDGACCCLFHGAAHPARPGTLAAPGRSTRRVVQYAAHDMRNTVRVC